MNFRILRGTSRKMLKLSENFEKTKYLLFKNQFLKILLTISINFISNYFDKFCIKFAETLPESLKMLPLLPGNYKLTLKFNDIFLIISENSS